MIGGLLGTAIGVVFGWILTESLSESTELSIPSASWPFFYSVVVGVLGAIAPARRASRVDVLEAIQHE